MICDNCRESIEGTLSIDSIAERFVIPARLLSAIMRYREAHSGQFSMESISVAQSQLDRVLASLHIR